VDTNKILQGNALEILKEFPSQSVNCCVTSPPYYALRDYEGSMFVWDGNKDCEHEFKSFSRKGQSGGVKSKKVKIKEKENFQKFDDTNQEFCEKCGAWNGRLGLEPSPEMYINHIVQIMMEVNRILTKDGTLWLNLGDSYAGSQTVGRVGPEGIDPKFMYAKGTSLDGKIMQFDWGYLKPKDLCMIPARIAIELQKKGWWLRNDIIWHKENSMPEPAQDRCSRSHEYIFLLTKNKKYYYDIDLIKEPIKSKLISSLTRNKRTVWSINTTPSTEKHFAMFPPNLVIPCILTGCPEGGIVLDPFMGTGTVALVCNDLKRKWIGIEQSSENVELMSDRLAGKKYGLKTLKEPDKGGILNISKKDIRITT
jgi:site-specific DNA-methyltransferase (adenine-specific)